MVLDSYIALSREEPVQFIWKGDLSDEDRALLGQLLANLPYFGRAESWCQASLSDGAEPNCHWVSPGKPLSEDYDLVRVLVPSSGVTLAELMVDTADLRGRQRRLDPPGSEWVLYAVRRDALSPSASPAVAPQLGGEGAVVVRYALDSVPLPPVTATVIIAELVRKAVMAQYGRCNEGKLSPILAGRDYESGPLKGNRHAYYLPTDEDCDGRLDHLTVYVPGGLDDKECEALANTNMVLAGAEVEIRLLLLGFSRAKDTVLGEFFGLSSIWQSATPFVLSRHPKRYRTGGMKTNEAGYQVDGPEDQIQREWRRQREANPTLSEIVDIERLPELRAGGRRLSWLDFRCSRSSSSAPPPAAVGGGFRITFAFPTHGPIALGYASHYGLGLFRPETGRQRELCDDKGRTAGDLG
jgi:CRISPR-associated protein Csb2